MCNKRILSNFGLESRDILWRAISNLGVVPNDSKRSTQDSLEVLKGNNTICSLEGKANYTPL